MPQQCLHLLQKRQQQQEEQALLLVQQQQEPTRILPLLLSSFGSALGAHTAASRTPLYRRNAWTALPAESCAF